MNTTRTGFHGGLFTIAFALSLVACEKVHQVQGVVTEDCARCHASDFQSANDPVHTSDPELYHQRCGDCHDTTSWSPALDGPHPEERFTLKGSHNYACLDCHNFERGDTSEEGADADCVGCHDGAHTPEVALGRHEKIPSFEIEEYVFNEPPWCMECHWGGRGYGKELLHPESRFAIERDPHKYECQDCHDTSIATMAEGNVNCTGCHDDDAHTEAAERENHADVAAYVFDDDDPGFCVDCHADVVPGVSVPRETPLPKSQRKQSR